MNAVFDPSRLEEITGGDREMTQMLLGLFAQTAQSVLERLQAGAHWRDTVHELKGAAANLGATALYEQCALLEPLTPTPEQREALFAQIRATITAIKAELA